MVGAKMNIPVRINEVRPNLTFLLGGSLNENHSSGECLVSTSHNQ